MRNNVLIVLGFMAEWFLFTFSLYQAVVEIGEQEVILGQIKSTSKEYREVPAFYWLVPPFKVWLEKKRVERILHDITVNTEDFDQIFSLSNRAIAWTYIAVAEILIGVISTNEILELFNIEVSNMTFVGINIFIIVISVMIVVYRTSDYVKNRVYRRYSEGK